jgi:glycosyltransferase involved in cell wall biosynthesis
MLLDFASRAFEHDIALRVITPLKGPLVQIFKNMGIPTEVVPAPESMLRGSQQVGHLRSLPAALGGLWKWSRRLVQHEFIRDADVTYSVAFKSHVALALGRYHPVVWHLHEFPPSTTGRLWRVFARWTPDAVIANSKAVGSAWGGKERTGGRNGSDTAVPSHRHTARPSYARNSVVPNGINLDRFKPAERTFWIHDRLGIPRDHRLVGMPAVFARWKGQIEAIEAFSLIADYHPDVHLVIVGGSIYDTLAEREFGRELEIELNRVATGEWAVVGVPSAGEQGTVNGSAAPRQNGSQVDGRADGTHTPQPPVSDIQPEDFAPPYLLPRVHLLPFQAKIERVFPEFDLALHYSLRPEPFGRVIVEAMACGIPVIAADEGGPREILGSGSGTRREAGWLAEPRKPAALAEVLRTALELPDSETRSIGEAGRRRAEDVFSWRHFAADVAGVLKGVAGEL